MMEMQGKDQDTLRKLHNLDFCLLRADKVFFFKNAPVDSLPINLSIQVFVFILHDKDGIMSTYIKFLCKCMETWTNKKQLK